MSVCILIVDDCAVIRDSVRDALEKEKDWIVCGEAINGQDGVEKAKRLNPDLIVLDLSMPVMNGLEAARRLKLILPTVPVVLFTSFDSTHLTSEALRAGCSAVVLKSTPVLLIDCIRGLLSLAA
jgi:DNA-binding NarL/FixJ family response regulator